MTWLTIFQYLISHLYLVMTSGAPDHPSMAIYEGNGIQAIDFAKQINGYLSDPITHLEVWPLS